MGKTRNTMGLDLRQGAIVSPIRGTMHYGPDGTPQGRWGIDKPMRYMQETGDGMPRVLTRAEHRLALRIYGPVTD